MGSIDMSGTGSSGSMDMGGTGSSGSMDTGSSGGMDMGGTGSGSSGSVTTPSQETAQRNAAPRLLVAKSAPRKPNWIKKKYSKFCHDSIGPRVQVEDFN